MLRAILVLFAISLYASGLRSEDAAHLSWRPTITSPKGPPLLLVQEPYCPLGIGACGGQCAEDGKKGWDCPADAIPCYQPGHCRCEEAGICKTKKKKQP
jgi:hypothetical protein